jgi:two-component system OmpR family sensor kinase
VRPGRRPRSADEHTVRRAARRIGLQAAAGVAVLVAVLFAIGIFVVLHSQRQAQDELIRTAIARADDVEDPPDGMWLCVWRSGLRAATPGLPAGFPLELEIRRVASSHVARSTDVDVRGGEFLVRTQRYDRGGVIQAVLDLSQDNRERARLLEGFAVAGGAGLVLSAGLGAVMARRAVAPMAAALALQRRFVADAGHELRTPLTLLSTRAQLIQRALRRYPDAEQVRSDVDDLVSDTRQLTALLDDLLVAADDRAPAVFEPVALAELAEQVVGSARPAAKEHGVALTAVSSGDRPVVWGSTAGMRRAVTALLDNAVRHARTAVSVSVGITGRFAVIDVTDDGSGIAPSARSTMFDRFAGTPADPQAGIGLRYGLGLALVSEIAARHGGSISLQAGEDNGTTFRLRLPRSYPSAPTSSASPRGAT